MNITEDFCSYEVAKLLKEKGFDYQGFDYIDFEGEVIRQDRPTHQMAMKWLRGKGFHINASISYDYSVDADGNVVDKWTFWIFEILSSISGELIYTEELNEYESYEQAVEAALKYSLENLI